MTRKRRGEREEDVDLVDVNDVLRSGLEPRLGEEEGGGEGEGLEEAVEDVVEEVRNPLAVEDRRRASQTSGERRGMVLPPSPPAQAPQQQRAGAHRGVDADREARARQVLEHALREDAELARTLAESMIEDICTSLGLLPESADECMQFLKEVAENAHLDIAPLLKAMLEVVENRGGLVILEVECDSPRLGLSSDGKVVVTCSDVPMVEIDDKLNMHLL